MRKRLLILLVCLISVLLAGYVTLRLTAPRHRITEENFAAIQKGMTEEEVEAILGAPAGVYGSGDKTGNYFVRITRIPREGFTFRSGLDLIRTRGGKEWVGEAISVYIIFDETGGVKEALGGFFLHNVPESFLAKLRRWVGIQ
jgi:outer membrane protein assembly factor BamE (lipoprotein component of BamABCDE complex)